MPRIEPEQGVVTQITTVQLPPDSRDAIVQLMTERARFMARQPGFVSVSLHRSQDGSHIVNYVQWKDRQQLETAHRSPEFRKAWSELGALAERIQPAIYDVVHVEG